MSSALWHFFWDWGGSPPAPTPSPSPTPAPAPATPLPGPPTDSAGGGGKGWGKGGKKNNIDFADWDSMGTVREAYLRGLFPLPPAPPPPGTVTPPSPEQIEFARKEAERKKQLEELNAERAGLIKDLRFAADVKAMKKCGTRIKEINAKIATLTGKQAVARFLR